MFQGVLMTESKLIIPLSPRYIQNKVKIYFLEASWHQVIISLFCIVLTTAAVGAVGGVVGLLVDVVALVVIWGSFYRFAWTEEKYLYTKSSLLYWLRRARKQTTVTAMNTNIAELDKLYPFAPKKILRSGIIDFGKGRYGVIIDCQVRPVGNEDLPQQIIKIQGLLKSIQENTLSKIRVSSYIPFQNPVEKMATSQISGTKKKEDKALLYSLYALSANGQKCPQWQVKFFISVTSSEKKIEHYFNTIIPGLLDRLHSATTTATVLTDERTIYQCYAREGSARQGIENKDTAIYGPASVWGEKIRQLMQGSVIERSDHLIVNHREYVSCLIVGVPVGGVAGFPPQLSPHILEQLYRISADTDHVIRIDYSIYPVKSGAALEQLKGSIKKLNKNEIALEGSQVSQYDLGLDIDDLKGLYSLVKDGTENIFNCNIAISVFSPSYELMISGLSKVSAVLDANNISNQIPTNRIFETIRAGQFYPYYNDKTAIWLPSGALARILPVTLGANNIISENGFYFGNEITTGQEIVIDLERLGAQHTLLIGSTRSGKTTELGLTGIRTVLAGQDFIYITNKPDWNTSYLAPAEWFRDRSQIINIGRQPDGTCKYNINPLEIMVNDGVQFDPLTKFYEHVDFVKLFLNLLTGGDRTDVQRGYIHEIVLRIYSRFGFDPSDPKTWKPAEQPTLSDLYDMWEEDLSLDPKDTTVKAILIRATGFKTTLKWLSNPTNVNLTAQYTVIDLSAVPPGAQEAANYLLINVLKLRFNPKSKIRTTIAFDECGVFLKQKELQDQLSLMLKQAASFRVRVILGSQMLEDLSSIGPELRSNIYISKVFGLNIAKNIDSAVSFFKFTKDDRAFLVECSKAGMAAVQVGYPYATTYHLQTVLSAVESEILFGKQEGAIAQKYTFVHPDLEAFAQEQGVIFADMINGDITELKKGRVAMWQQNPLGVGKVWAYVKADLLKDSKIGNQNPEHYLSVCYISSWLIEADVRVEVNHYDDADIVAYFPGGSCAFEWQSAGHNDVKNLMQKRMSNESKYGRMLFIGPPESCKEMRSALQDRDIVVERGQALQRKLNEMINEGMYPE